MKTVKPTPKVNINNHAEDITRAYKGPKLFGNNTFVAKHPLYPTAWYVFDYETGAQVSPMGGGTRKEAIKRAKDFVERVADRNKYSEAQKLVNKINV